MLKRIKSVLTRDIGSIGKIAYLLIIITILSFISSTAQDKDSWTNAVSGTTKIFTISFIDDVNGLAKSGEGDVLTTTDGGNTWEADKHLLLPAENFLRKFFGRLIYIVQL